jgi:hypothetical protein
MVDIGFIPCIFLAERDSRFKGVEMTCGADETLEAEEREEIDIVDDDMEAGTDEGEFDRVELAGVAEAWTEWSKEGIPAPARG